MKNSIESVADLATISQQKAWERTGNIGSIISFYESDQTYPNRQLSYCLGGNYIEMYQAQRKGLERVCYHIHIKDRPDSHVFSRARRYMGGNQNYEIGLVGNKWTVMTGAYEIKKVTRSYDRYYSEMYFPVDRKKLKILKEFNHDEFLAARNYCLLQADPFKGKICWRAQDKNTRRGLTFIGAVDYEIVENDDCPTAPYQTFRTTDGKVLEKDGINLNKNLGAHATVAAAQAACQKNYEEFCHAYMHDKPLDPKTLRLVRRVKIGRPKFQQEFMEELCRWVEITHASGKYYYLYHASNEKLNYLVVPGPTTHQAYKITTLLNGYYRSSSARSPEVEVLPIEGDRAALQAYCLEDLKKEYSRVWFLDWRRLFKNMTIN